MICKKSPKIKFKILLGIAYKGIKKWGKSIFLKGYKQYPSAKAYKF